MRPNKGYNTRTILLQDHFAFAQWDSTAEQVTGLTLYDGPAGYARNYTLLSKAALKLA